MAFPYNLLCFDNDGTLSLSDQPFGDIVSRLMRLSLNQGIRLIMITNNSSKDDRTYQVKLEKMGFAPGAVALISPIVVATVEFKKRGFERGFIVGNDLCRDEFARRGIRHDDQSPDFVLVAYDTSLTYDKLVRACALVRGGVPLFQSHSDPLCPGLEGDLPDCGLIIKLISAPSGVEPIESFGKESESFARYLASQAQGGERAVVIGDRLHTDIALAQRLSWDGVWINKASEATGDLQPRYIHPSFSEFLARFGC